MNMGLNFRQIDGILYGLQIILGVLVFFAVKIPGPRSLFILGLAYLIGISFFAVIHFLNRNCMDRKKSAEEPLPAPSSP
jgi:hypothetical protein